MGKFHEPNGTKKTTKNCAGVQKGRNKYHVSSLARKLAVEEAHWNRSDPAASSDTNSIPPAPCSLPPPTHKAQLLRVCAGRGEFLGPLISFSLDRKKNNQCQIPLKRRYCLLAEASFHRLWPFEI